MSSDNTLPPNDPPPAYLSQERIEPPPSPRSRERLHKPAKEGRWLVPSLLALVTLSAFSVALWFSYQQGVRKGMQFTPPLIAADSSPVKELPEKPGGREIPHQDKKIYELMDGGDMAEEEVLLRPKPAHLGSKKQLLSASETESEELKLTSPTKSQGSDVVDENKPPETRYSKAESNDKPSDESTNSDDSMLNKQAAIEVEAKKDTKSKNSEGTLVKAEVGRNSNILEKYRVQLGAFTSIEAAEIAWTRLKKEQDSLLRSLNHIVQQVDLGDKGIYYRLQAGPLDGPGAARAMCAKLQQQKLDCLAIRPAEG